MTDGSPGSPAVPRSGAGLRRTAAWLALGAAVVRLVVAQLAGTMPLRQGLGRSTDVARAARTIAGLGRSTVARAGGGNVQLHFVPDGPLTPAGGQVVAGTYFGLNYSLYPARAFVGRDDRVLNDERQVLLADALPTTEWMRAHGVTVVVQMTRGPSGWSYASRPVR